MRIAITIVVVALIAIAMLKTFELSHSRLLM